MPIVKCHANKRALSDTVSYITNPIKVIAIGNQGFMTADPQKMVAQMQETLRLHGKQKGRQYYHVKVAFAPADRPENGGSLTAEKANSYASKYSAYLWPGNEVIWAVQDHGVTIHIHFIVSACEAETGKKLDVDNHEYCRWKDYAQTLAVEFGLSPLDWREAVKRKKAQDRQTGSPVYESFAEKGRKAKGKGTYKDQLRSIIDQALSKSKNMEEFRTELEKFDVSLTRCTAATISYKWGESRRACRGDSLGDDYTAISVLNRLRHNQQQTRLDAKIKTSEQRTKGKHILSTEELTAIHNLGRIIGMTHDEVKELIDHALYSNNMDKQKVWKMWRVAQNQFWKSYKKQQKEISEYLDVLYRKRRLLHHAEYLMHPNSKTTLWGILYGVVLRLSENYDFEQIEQEIAYYKTAREKLRREIACFKEVSAKGMQAIKTYDFQLDEYLVAVSKMHTCANDAFYAALAIPPERQFILTENYTLASRAEQLRQTQKTLDNERR